MKLTRGISYPVLMKEIDGTDIKVEINFNTGLDNEFIEDIKYYIESWYEVASNDGYGVGAVQDLFGIRYVPDAHSFIVKFSLGNATIQSIYILFYILDNSVNIREEYFPLSEYSKIKIDKGVISGMY